MEPDATLAGVHCTLTVRRPYEGVVVMIYRGPDVGELGDWPFRQLAKDLEPGLPIEIWVDGRDTPGASIAVSGAWAEFLAKHRAQIHRVNFLAGSGLLEVTGAFVGRFAGLGRRMRLYRDPEQFARALAAACDPGVR